MYNYFNNLGNILVEGKIMRAIKLLGHISENHTLNLDLPEDVVEGPAEVIVLIPEEDASRESANIKEFLLKLSRQSRKTRSKQEIDRYLEAERCDWD